MEQLPNPEEEPIRIINQCPECEEYTVLDDENTLIFQDNEGDWAAYIKCQFDCEPEVLAITPETMEYFAYLTNWYTQEGKISPLEIQGVLLQPVLTVEPTITLENQWDAFIAYVEPWEIITHGKFRTDKHD